MQHTMPTMQDLVNYQLAEDMKETDRQIEAANVFQEKLDTIDNLVRRYATWDMIFQDILDADGEPNKNGITLDDCFDMKSDIMDKIKRLVTN